VEKYCVELGRQQMAVWCMRTACWIPKVTNSHSQYAILITFPLRQWLHERASMLRYTHIGCIVITETKCVYCAVQTCI